MGDKTKIEWTEASWTPIRAYRDDGRVGWHCEHVSEGCRFCYAEVLNLRLGTRLDYKPGHRSNITIKIDEKMLTQPMRWKRPRRIFVCSMTDLFADFVTDDMLDRVFAAMALSPQHTFQVLTKRPERMLDYCKSLGIRHRLSRYAQEHDGRDLNYRLGDYGWHLPNVWLGTSVEDQENADARIPHLLQTPAAVRFLSCEPLLGPLRLMPDGGAIGTPGVQWVIVGGESGPNARPFNTEWARSIVEQCEFMSIACFVKQMGSNVVQDGEHRIKKDRKGGDMSEFPHDIRVRQYPVVA